MIRTCSRIAAAVLVPVLAGVVTAGTALAGPQPQHNRTFWRRW
jgi:hypothetical protein